MATKGLETEKLVEQLKGSLKKPAGKKDKPKLPAKAKGPAKKSADKPVTRRAARYPDSAIIELTPLGKKENPKRPSTDARALYDIYLKNPKGLTVGKYVELAGKTNRPKAGRTAINWDVARKYITVSSK